MIDRLSLRETPGYAMRRRTLRNDQVYDRRRRRATGARHDRRCMYVCRVTMMTTGATMMMNDDDGQDRCR